jgi:hypothetical protein
MCYPLSRPFMADDRIKYHTYVYKNFSYSWMGVVNFLANIFTDFMSSTNTKKRINLQVK